MMSGAAGPARPPLLPAQADVPEGVLTREQMLALGAYGFLTHAVEQAIPVDKIERMLTVPACPAWGSYSGVSGRKPVEVKYSAESDAYLLFAGTELVEAARQQGLGEILAFVEPDQGRTR